MPQLNMMHFLVAKKLAGDAPDASRAGLIGALSRDPLTAFFAGRAAKLQHEAKPTRPAPSTPSSPSSPSTPSGTGGGSLFVIDEAQVRALGGAYRTYKDAPADDKLKKLLEEVEKILSLR